MCSHRTTLLRLLCLRREVYAGTTSFADKTCRSGRVHYRPCYGQVRAETTSFTSRPMLERSSSCWNHIVHDTNHCWNGRVRAGTTSFTLRTMLERSSSCWNHIVHVTNHVGTVEFVLEPHRSRHEPCWNGRRVRAAVDHQCREVCEYKVKPAHFSSLLNSRDVLLIENKKATI